MASIKQKIHIVFMRRFPAFYDADTLVCTLRRKKFFVAQCQAGLGNRIKCLVSAMRLADKYDGKVLCYWPLNEECGCPFADLFVNDIPLIVESERRAILSRSDRAQFHILKTWKFEVLQEDCIPNNFSTICGSLTKRNIDYEYTRIPLSAKHTILPYLKRLVPVDYVQNEVKAFGSRFNEKTVSVAMRSWRTTSDGQAARHRDAFSVDQYVHEASCMKATSAFICSDAREVTAEFVKKFSGQAFEYPKRSKPSERSSKEAVQDALVELLLLARNQQMVLTRWSTFSELSWWLGNCPEAVELI